MFQTRTYTYFSLVLHVLMKTDHYHFLLAHTFINKQETIYAVKSLLRTFDAEYS